MNHVGHDAIVDSIERNYNVRATESEAKGLFYLEDDKRKSIGILAIRNGNKSMAKLTKEQAYALIDEFKDVCDMYFREGRYD